MQVKFKDRFEDNFRNESIEDFVQDSLDDSCLTCHCRTHLDQTVENTTQAIGRLLSVLADKDLLNAEEISHILGGKYDDVELVEEE